MNMEIPTTSADGLLEGPTAAMCEKGGRCMADAPQTSVCNRVQSTQHASDSSASAKTSSSTIEPRRVYKRSIKRLEHIIALQKAQSKKIRRQSVNTPSHTHRLQVAMKDVQLISTHTLDQLKQSGKLLELSWAMLED